MTDQLEFRKLYSEDSEQQLLGSLLILSLSEPIYSDITFNPSDLYYPSHENMLSTLLKLSSEGKPCNPWELHAYYEERNELHLVDGGVEYFKSLMDSTVNANRYKSYITVIQEYAKERRLTIAGRGIQSIIDDKDLSHNDRIANSQKLFDDALSDDSEDQGTVAVNQVLKEYIDLLDWRFNNDAIMGVMTGIQSVDERLKGLQDGELYIFAGRPGSGKSTYATNIMLNAASMGSKCYFLSMEMPRRQLMQRMLACKAGITLNSLKDASALGDHSSEIVVAVNAIKQMSIEIDDNSNVDIEVFINRCRKQKRKHGLDIVFADYLQLMTDRTVRDNKRLEVGGITRKLKGLAKELSIPVVLLSQLNRKCEERTDKRPWLSDLAESGDVEANADVVQMLYRDEYYDEDSPAKGIIEIITRKFREGETGTDHANFVGAKNQIKNLEHSYTPPPPPEKSYKKRGF